MGHNREKFGALLKSIIGNFKSTIGSGLVKVVQDHSAGSKWIGQQSYTESILTKFGMQMPRIFKLLWKAVLRKLVKGKAVANSPVSQVLAEPLFLKAKTKFHFTKSK